MKLMSRRSKTAQALFMIREIARQTSLSSLDLPCSNRILEIGGIASFHRLRILSKNPYLRKSQSKPVPQSLSSNSIDFMVERGRKR